MSARTPVVIQSILDACPQFQQAWHAYVAEDGACQPGEYMDIAQVAHFIVEAYAAGDSSIAARIFPVAEEFLRTGSDEQKGLVTVGLLETVQTIATHHEFGPGAFVPLLPPLCSEAWRQIEDTWAG